MTNLIFSKPAVKKLGFLTLRKEGLDKDMQVVGRLPTRLVFVS